MLSTATGQVGFFDAAELMGPLPEGSFFAVLAEHGERVVRDEDFADCYSERLGRPSIPPSQLAKVLLLQYRTGLSDEQAMEAVAWDLRWKIALGLPVDHAGWNSSSLTRFRARLLLHGKERLALENTLSLAGELGLLDAPAEQIVDSTPMLGAAATQDTVRLVRSGVRGLIDAVAGADEHAAQALDDGLEFDYSRPAEKPDCRWREKAERERMLTRVAEDAERALRAVERADGLLAEDAVREAHSLLRELVGQDFDVDATGVPRLHRGTRQDRIISTVDPEMRHGRKSRHQRFDGYKLSAAATNAAEPLITAVEVAAASEQDGPQAKRLIDAQPAERRPERVLGDTAYGNSDTLEELEQRDVGVLAPPATSRTGSGFHKEDFEIDLVAGTVTCPAGKVGPDLRARPPGRAARQLPPLGLRCLSTQAALHRERPSFHPDRSPRRPPASRPARARGSRHRRAPAPHPTADRAAARPARPPLRCPKDPLHRRRQSPLAGALDRRPGQPQPDRPPAGRTARLIEGSTTKSGRPTEQATLRAAPDRRSQRATYSAVS
jgi:transposase